MQRARGPTKGGGVAERCCRKGGVAPRRALERLRYVSPIGLEPMSQLCLWLYSTFVANRTDSVVSPCIEFLGAVDLLVVTYIML